MKLFRCFSINVLLILLPPSILLSQPSVSFEGPSLNANAVENRYWGYRINPGRVVIRGLRDEKITLITWAAGSDGEWKESRDTEIHVKSDPFIIPSGAVTHFFGDMFLTDVFGRGPQRIKFNIMAHHSTRGQMCDKEFDAGTVNLGSRTTSEMGEQEDWESIVIRNYYPWDANKRKEILLQPYKHAVIMKPQGESYFAFTYSITVPKTGRDIISIRYLNDGNRMLVSDENSYLFLMDINSGNLIWKRQAVPGTRLSSEVFDISPDDRFFLTGQAQWVTGSTRSLRIHRMSDGEVLKEIDEKSTWFEMPEDKLAMLCVYAKYDNKGKSIRTIWRNARLGESMYDLSMKTYDAVNYKKRWEWQILDPEKLDYDAYEREYHMDFTIDPVEGKTDQFRLYSRTDKVYLLTPDIIKRAMPPMRHDKKPRPKYLYTLPDVAPSSKGTWLRGVQPSIVRTMHWGAFIDGDYSGALGLVNLATGEVTWRTLWPMSINGFRSAGNGRFLFITGEKMLRVWDARSRYLVFNSHIDGPVDLHPKKREIAVAQAGRVRFAIERPRAVFTLSGSWQEIDLYADPDTGIFAYGDNPVEYGMHRKGDGSPRKTAHDYGGLNNQINMRHDDHWMRWLKETGQRGTKLMVKAALAGTKLETWGGLSGAEYGGSVPSLRSKLLAW